MLRFSVVCNPCALRFDRSKTTSNRLIVAIPGRSLGEKTDTASESKSSNPIARERPLQTSGRSPVVLVEERDPAHMMFDVSGTRPAPRATLAAGGACLRIDGVVRDGADRGSAPASSPPMARHCSESIPTGTRRGTRATARRCSGWNPSAMRDSGPTPCGCRRNARRMGHEPVRNISVSSDIFQNANGDERVHERDRSVCWLTSSDGECFSRLKRRSALGPHSRPRAARTRKGATVICRSTEGHIQRKSQCVLL